jgi:hypothetical protein
MFAFFDIETTGLNARTDDFRCAVAEDDDGVHRFTDLEAFTTYILTTKATFVTFNGAAFDFNFLAEKTDDNLQKARLAQLAALSIDLMFDFMCDHGYRCSLNSFAEPLGGSKSQEGGWAATCTNMDELLEYCALDVRILKQVYQAGEENAFLHRHTKAKKLVVWTLARSFRTVKAALEAVKQNPPDQSWQTDPVDIVAAVTWIETALTNVLA